jgi:serine/threonine protein kinase
LLMDDSSTDVRDPHGDDDLPPRLLRKLHIQITGYELISIIGEGGQGVVFKATQENTGEIVAIKVLREGPLATPSARERFRREVAVLRQLEHPYIVRIRDFGETYNGYDYLVTDYVAGQPLRRLLESHRAKFAASQATADDSDRLLCLFAKVCRAVGHAHDHGVVHRDLSPSNILVDDRGEPCILDFGLARGDIDWQATSRQQKITITGQFMGKLAYASPEQAACDFRRVGKPADVYALGVILYEILTGGELPCDVAGNVLDALDNIISRPPMSPSKRLAARCRGRKLAQRSGQAPTIKPAIECVALKSLAKDPAERFASASDLTLEVENYLAGLTITAQPRPKPRDWRAPVGAGTAVALMAITWFSIQGTRTKSAVELPTQGRLVSATPRDLQAATDSAVSKRQHRDATVPLSVPVVSTLSKNAAVKQAMYSSLEVLGGPWRIDGDELVLEPIVPMSVIGFGDPQWSEYDFSFEVNKQNAATCVGAMFHWRDGSNRYMFHLGAAGNRWHEVVHSRDGHLMSDQRLAKPGRIEAQYWYMVHVKVRGSQVVCFVDDEALFHVEHAQIAQGKVGIEIGAGPARIRNVRVVAADGTMLWNELPDPRLNGADPYHEAADTFAAASVWNGVGPGGGKWSIVVDTRDHECFAARLIRPDGKSPTFAGWVRQGLFRSNDDVLIGTIRGDKVISQPCGARGQITFQRAQ